VIVNSKFTKRIVDQEYDISSQVLYPPVELIQSTTPKEKIILSVGRFEPSLNAKKHDILITAFKQFSQENPGWRLCLAGGSSSESWLAKLQALASGYPIEFYDNVAYDKLQNLYQKATIYWHAAGYEVDEQKNPELTEHFGITTVEALSAGCVAFVVGKGGQTEIITDPSFYWDKPRELAEKTQIWLNNPTPQDFDLTPYASTTFAQNFQNLLI
jgi:glycosyltransferase involved in cell wall biosynthesis